MNRPSTGSTPDAVPVLPVADLERALAHYERLGFELQAKFPGYAIVGFEGAEVHLAEAPEVAEQETWTGAYLRVADADALHQRWAALGATILSAPADQPYGIREFASEDPDGNLWRVGSPIGPAEGESPVDPDEVFVDEFAQALADATAPSRADADATGPTRQPTGPDRRLEGAASTGRTPARGDEVDWFELVSSDATCPQCGLVNGELHRRAIGAECRDLAHALGELLTGADDDDVRARAAERTWSALEYGVHVRDGLNVFSERIVRTLAERAPELPGWDHEEAIADGMANESDVQAVADDLGRNASKLSEALRLVTADDDWERTATVAGAWTFTIELLARVALHELVHHTADARAALEATGSRG